MSRYWLNSLPAHWTMPPVYARFSVQLGKMLDEKRIKGTHLAPYLRNVDVQWDRINTEDLPEMDFTDEDRRQFALRKGDLLVCEGGEVGRTAVWNGELGECYYQKALHRVRPLTDRDDSRFFRYFMRAAVDAGVFATATASTIQHLTAEQLRVVRYPSPPPTEQTSIADFLDRETARLDALVAAKERLLGLLAEKRRALITRAVSRGLNPDAQLRNSGLPWLGQIPAHWDLRKIGHIAKVGNGSTPSRENAGYWVDGTLPWLNSSIVNESEATSANQFITELALKECHLPLVSPGSVLVAITGQGKTRGSAVVLSFEATINQHLAYVTPARDTVAPWYLRWLIFAAYGFLRAVSDDAGGTKGALTCEELGTMKVPLPPIYEQRAIVALIASETAKLDALRAAAEQTIRLLKERRAALIAAAVTGKLHIDTESAREPTAAALA